MPAGQVGPGCDLQAMVEYCSASRPTAKCERALECIASSAQAAAGACTACGCKDGLHAMLAQLPLANIGALWSMQGSGCLCAYQARSKLTCCRINLEGEMTYARVDDDGNAVREADGSLQMRPAQPMEYANGVCYS